MIARGGGRRHYLDRPYNGATTDGAELEKLRAKRASWPHWIKFLVEIKNALAEMRRSIDVAPRLLLRPQSERQPLDRRASCLLGKWLRHGN